MAGFFDSLFDDEPTSFFVGHRAPGGSSSAGLAAPVSDRTPAPQSISEAAPDILTYPDGTPVTDPFGHLYPRPPTLDMRKNLEIGQTIKDASENADIDVGQSNPSLMFAPQFVAGASMDYKRPDGFFGPYKRQYRPVSYYNYGVMAAKVGYGRAEALRNAGLYNRYFGAPAAPGNRYGLDGDDAEKFIEQGYDDYMNGHWTPKSAD